MSERFKNVEVGDNVWVKSTVTQVYGSGDGMTLRLEDCGWVQDDRVLLSSEIGLSDKVAPSRNFKAGDVVRVDMVDSRWEGWVDRLASYFYGEFTVEDVDCGDLVEIEGWQFPSHWLSLVEAAEDVESEEQTELSSLKQQAAELLARIEALEKK